MASLPPQDCCTQGVKYEGTPKGSFIDIGAISTYVAGDRSSKKVLLLLTDVLGPTFTNCQLISDAYAKQGYYVVMPDLFNGDPKPLNAGMSPEWFNRHTLEVTQPIVDEVVNYIKSELKPVQLSSIGYCFGARYVVRLLGTKAIDVGAIAHPSFVQLEEVAAVQKPLIIIGAETDPIYTPEHRFATEAKLHEIKATYFTTQISGTSHGFALRVDTNDKWMSLAVNKAFSDSVWWFKTFE